MSDHSDLIARLLDIRNGDSDLTYSAKVVIKKAATDLREQALKIEDFATDYRIASAERDELRDERDTLRAEIAVLRKDAKRSC